MGLFDAIMDIFDINSPERDRNFCKTPQLMEYMAKFSMKSDNELEKLAKSKDTIKAAAAKQILDQHKRNTEETE